MQRLINIVAASIKQGREAKRMSQEQLAEALGCSLKYVKRIEGGEVHFRMNLLFNLSRVLQLSPFENVEI